MQLESVPHDGASDLGEDSELETHFFSTPPAPIREHDAAESASAPPPMPRTSQLVMVATVAMLATAALVIPLTLIYGKSLGAGADGMLSHEGPYLPDSAAYREAIRAIEEPVVTTETMAATAPSEGPTRAAQPDRVEAEVPGDDVAAPGTVPPPGESPQDGTAPDTVAPQAVPAAAGPEGVPAQPSGAPVATMEHVSDGASNAPDAVNQPGVVAAPPLAIATPSPQAAQPEAEAPAATATVEAPPVSTAPASRDADKARARRKRARMDLDGAFALFNAGKFKAAERAARRIANRNPKRANAWLLLGAARDAQGNRAGAIAAYNVCSARAEGPAAMDCMRLAGGH